jgi:hypothetical protein
MAYIYTGTGLQHWMSCDTRWACLVSGDLQQQWQAIQMISKFSSERNHYPVPSVSQPVIISSIH